MIYCIKYAGQCDTGFITKIKRTLSCDYQPRTKKINDIFLNQNKKDNSLNFNLEQKR